MPFQPGRAAQVFFNGYDVSGYLDSAELSLDQDTGDTTTFGATGGAKTYLPTVYGASLSTSGFFDPSANDVITAATAVDGGVATFCPSGGRTVGDLARIITVTTTSYGQSSPVGEVVAFSWELLSESTLAFGAMLHPLGEDTNTTTGTGRNDSAATTAGWTASLHVTLVDGGSWVVKLEDSANGSSWSDVSGGAFTAATGITAQRLSSAAGATLRQYVRYTATRTSGTAGDGITFALAYARSL